MFSVSLGAQAKAKGISAREVLHDYLAAGEGSNMIYFPIFNYLKGNLDTVRDMLLHPNARYALGDAGAHVGTVCDASSPTTMLAHWAVQRTRGKRLPLPLPLPFVVHMLTGRNAAHMGLTDRGVIAVGKKADINRVDLEKLALGMPTVVPDLPSGGRRVIQKSRGNAATFVAGEAVIEDGQISAARPGRWVQSRMLAA